MTSKILKWWNCFGLPWRKHFSFKINRYLPLLLPWIISLEWFACCYIFLIEMLICAREVICLLSSDMDNHLIFYPLYMPFSVNLPPSFIPPPPSSHLKLHYIWKIFSSVWDIWIHINSLCTNFFNEILYYKYLFELNYKAILFYIPYFLKLFLCVIKCLHLLFIFFPFYVSFVGQWTLFCFGTRMLFHESIQFLSWLSLKLSYFST